MPPPLPRGVARQSLKQASRRLGRLQANNNKKSRVRFCFVLEPLHSSHPRGHYAALARTLGARHIAAAAKQGKAEAAGAPPRVGCA